MSPALLTGALTVSVIAAGTYVWNSGSQSDRLGFLSAVVTGLLVGAVFSLYEWVQRSRRARAVHQAIGDALNSRAERIADRLEETRGATSNLSPHAVCRDEIGRYRDALDYLTEKWGDVIADTATPRLIEVLSRQGQYLSTTNFDRFASGSLAHNDRAKADLRAFAQEVLDRHSAIIEELSTR